MRRDIVWSPWHERRTQYASNAFDPDWKTLCESFGNPLVRIFRIQVSHLFLCGPRQYVDLRLRLEVLPLQDTFDEPLFTLLLLTTIEFIHSQCRWNTKLLLVIKYWDYIFIRDLESNTTETEKTFLQLHWFLRLEQSASRNCQYPDSDTGLRQGDSFAQQFKFAFSYWSCNCFRSNDQTVKRLFKQRNQNRLSPREN